MHALTRRFLDWLVFIVLRHDCSTYELDDDWGMGTAGLTAQNIITVTTADKWEPWKWEMISDPYVPVCANHPQPIGKEANTCCTKPLAH